MKTKMVDMRSFTPYGVVWKVMEMEKLGWKPTGNHKGTGLVEFERVRKYTQDEILDSIRVYLETGVIEGTLQDIYCAVYEDTPPEHWYKELNLEDLAHYLKTEE